MKNIAILASGNGSNAQQIAEHFKGHAEIKTALIISNKKDAYVLERARKQNIPSCTFSNEHFRNSEIVLRKFKEYNIDFIVLAGFMIKISSAVISDFPKRIINIHPALLPKYGGKGMYGDFVHQAVIAAKEKESGITIHYVNEQYDEGAIIFQAKCIVGENETPESLAEKVHELEHLHYPKIIDQVVTAL